MGCASAVMMGTHLAELAEQLRQLAHKHGRDRRDVRLRNAHYAHHAPAQPNRPTHSQFRFHTFTCSHSISTSCMQAAVIGKLLSPRSVRLTTWR